MSEILKDKYREWYNNLKDNEKRTKPYFLFPEQQNYKIMLFGKEANESNFPNTEFNALYDYCREENQKYNNNPSKHDSLLKFKNKVSSKCNILKQDIIINNINKISLNGRNTSSKKFKNAFSTVEDNYTIHQLEIKELNPEIIICCCGPTYKKHIEKAFDTNLSNIGFPSCDNRIIDITNCFKNYSSIHKAIWCFHPIRMRNIDIDKIAEMINN